MAFRRLLLLVAATAFSLCAQSGFYLKAGDRVVFYGDSITDQRLYTTFVETYAVTRFPGEKFTFVHSGWGGDRVTGGGGGPIDTRLPRDVFAYKPTVMTIMLGMNDGSYRAFDQAIFDTYASGYEHIVDSVKKALPGIRITAIEPSPFDDITRAPMFEGGYNAVLLKYSDFLKKLAARDHIDIADLNNPVTAALTKAKTADPDNAAKLISDRIHPGPAGHLIMAEALLKAWHAPSLVSDVSLDIVKHKQQANNATVSDWSGMRWTVTEKSLPMPIDWSDSLIALAVNSSDILEALNQENLSVKGLKSGNWMLKIDDQQIGTFPSDDLAKGINLARYKTPMMTQALAVHQYTLKRSVVHNARWREIQVPLESEGISTKDSAMKAMDDLDAQVAELQRGAAQPKPHTYELVPQP